MVFVALQTGRWFVVLFTMCSRVPTVVVGLLGSGGFRGAMATTEPSDLLYPALSFARLRGCFFQNLAVGLGFLCTLGFPVMALLGDGGFCGMVQSPCSRVLFLSQSPGR